MKLSEVKSIIEQIIKEQGDFELLARDELGSLNDIRLFEVFQATAKKTGIKIIKKLWHRERN